MIQAFWKSYAQIYFKRKISMVAYQRLQNYILIHFILWSWPTSKVDTAFKWINPSLKNWKKEKEKEKCI